MNEPVMIINVYARVLYENGPSQKLRLSYPVRLDGKLEILKDTIDNIVAQKCPGASEIQYILDTEYNDDPSEEIAVVVDRKRALLSPDGF